MENKIVIELKKIRKVKYSFQILKYCTHCGNFSSLRDNACMVCTKEDCFISLDKKLDSITKWIFNFERLCLLLLGNISIILSVDFTQMALSFSITAILLIALFFIQRLCRESERKNNFFKLIRRNTHIIKSGLELDIKECDKDILETKYGEAYEKLRDVGIILMGDNIKLKKLVCIEHFALDTSMQLEMDALVLSQYHSGLIQYIFDISRLNRSLIKRKTIEYILRYEVEILKYDNGREILGSIAGAVIRIKQYLEEYSGFVTRYVERMEKTRLLRLCKLMAYSGNSDWGQLLIEVKRVIRKDYGNDIEFKFLIS